MSSKIHLAIVTSGGENVSAGVPQPSSRQHPTLSLFHQHMRHTSEDVFRTLRKIQGTILQSKSLPCSICARGKIKKKAIPSLADILAVPTIPG